MNISEQKEFMVYYRLYFPLETIVDNRMVYGSQRVKCSTREIAVETMKTILAAINPQSELKWITAIPYKRVQK